MSDDVRKLPGARDASIHQINEIIRGSTIKRITPEKGMADDGGHVMRIELNGGDFLLIHASPTDDGIRLAGGPTATLKLGLIHKRLTNLKI